MNIRLHIERVVIEGLPADAAQVRASLEAELARLISQNGLSPELHQRGAVASLRGDALRPDRNLGRGIARSVYGGIGR
jgi:hypothetical protein